MAYTIDELDSLLKKEYEHWESAYRNGLYDPFWPDGTNLNLTRNHIIYYKRQMEQLAGAERRNLFGDDLPVIYYKELPPEVDNNYMANPDKIRQRAKEQIALYEEDENFQYLLQIKDTLYPKNQEPKESKEAKLPFYPILRLAYYRKSFEEDDLVALRRDFYVDYERKAADWKGYAEQIKAFLNNEISDVEILPHTDKKESLEAKLERLASKETSSNKDNNRSVIHKINMPQEPKKERFHEEQLSLF